MPRRPLPPSCTIGSEVSTGVAVQPAVLDRHDISGRFGHHDQVADPIDVPGIGQIIRHDLTDQSPVVVAEIGLCAAGSLRKRSRNARTFARARSENAKDKQRFLAIVAYLRLLLIERFEVNKPLPDGFHLRAGEHCRHKP